MSIKDENQWLLLLLLSRTATPNDRENVINFMQPFMYLQRFRRNDNSNDKKGEKKTVIFNYYSQQFPLHSFRMAIMHKIIKEKLESMEAFEHNKGD